MRVVTSEMPQMASVCIGVWAGVGSRIEPTSIGGIAHFIEHLAFKGTNTRTAKQITDSIEGAGGYLNAFTAEENTCYYARVHHQQTLDALEVLADMYMAPKFSAPEIEKERGVIRDEISMYYDQPSQYVLELLNETIWPDHPLGRPITGTVESLERITRKHIRAFHRRNYSATTGLFAAAGRVSHEKIVKRARQLTRCLDIHPAASQRCSIPIQTSANINLHRRECEQVQIAIGIRCCSRHDPRRHSLRVLNTVLGENMSSRLWQSLREKHGLAYNIYSSVGLFEDDGSLTISAGVETDAAVEAFDLICRELARLVRNAPTEKELTIARDYLVGQLDLNLENTENHMMWIGEQVLGYGKLTSTAAVKTGLRKTTTASIHRVAKEFFREEKLSVALVGPLKSGKPFREVIKKHFQ